MNNLGLFFQFGIRMQGGPAFIKRTREAVSQLQTRTRSTFSCNCTTTQQGCGNAGGCAFNSTPTEFGCTCVYDEFCIGFTGQPWYCYKNVTTCQTCYTAYGAWSNTTSCTPSSVRECQTIYIFRDEDWSAYEEVDVCTTQTPTPALNAVQIECVPQ
jgi:hypothetical protein